jgi:MerR family redox-sensitive transcriptional activator SoxR
MEDMTIGDVAQRAGLRTSAIRYYESINLLPPARRVGGQRRYDGAVLDRLAFIQVAQRLGFTLAEIESLFYHQRSDTPLPELWQTLARQKLAEVERMIQHALDLKQLLVQGLDCGCADLGECIDCVRTQCEHTT